jgi:trk system potassium uptake protein
MSLALLALRRGFSFRDRLTLTVSISLVIMAAWLILMTHRLPLNMVLFEVISAFATCGLSLGITGELNLFGRFLLIILMLWGRCVDDCDGFSGQW